MTKTDDTLTGVGTGLGFLVGPGEGWGVGACKKGRKKKVLLEI